MTRPGIEPRSPGPLANTLTARPIVQVNFCFICLMALQLFMGYLFNAEIAFIVRSYLRFSFTFFITGFLTLGPIEFE